MKARVKWVEQASFLGETESNHAVLMDGSPAAGGRNLGLGISGLTYTPNSVDATNVTVRRISDGATVGSLTTTCGTGNPGGRCDVNLRNLAAGDYAIQITPPSGSTSTPPTSVSMTLTLSTDVAPLPKLVAGAATLIGVTHTGQNARLTFDGLVGDRRGLAISGLTSEDNQWLGVTILKPDNTTVLVSAFATVAAGVSVIDIPILDAGGVYTVYLDPAYASIASASVTLSNDAVGTLPIDGTPQNVTLNGLGQYATYDFTVSTPGQNLGLGLSALALTPASGGVNLVLDKIGGVQTGCYLGPPVNGCALNLANLAAGSYRILAKPPAPTTAASFTLTLSTEVTGPKLTLGTPYSLAVNRYGQNARLSFGGVVGENRRVTVTSLQGLPAGQYVRIGVRRPSDGYQFMYNGVTGPGGSFDISNLAQTGDYTLWFAGDYGQTYSLTVNVTQY